MLKILTRPGPDQHHVYTAAGEGPFPGLLLLHGSEGGWSGWSHRQATLFAAHGFAAYPFPYSRNGNAWNAGDIVDVALDRTEDALARFRALPFVAPKVGLYGGSRGGEHALLLVSLMAQDKNAVLPDAVAAHTPADVVCGAFRAATFRDSDEDREPWDPGLMAWTWRGSSDEVLPGTKIEIERYGGPLFLSHGTSDKVWTVEMTRRLEARLRAAGRDPEVHYYEGQGHGFDPETGNLQNERLLAFFGRHLSG